MSSITSLEDVKLSNRQVILQQMRHLGPASCTQLAKKTHLSKATVSRILSQMIDEGLIEEVRTSKSGVGRPNVLLQLAARARHAVGIELTSNYARISLTDINAHPLKQRIQPLYNQDVEQTVIQLAMVVKELARGLSQTQLAGVGIAVPGMVDSKRGIVSMELPSGWQDVPLVEHLEEFTGLPVSVINQAQAAAWGEKWNGKDQSISDLLYIRLGTVVDAGLVINGHLHSGKTLTAGAIGHMTLDPGGVECSCGNHGCLNTVASTPAILASTRALIKDERTSLMMGMVDGNPSLLTLDHLMQAVHAGDDLAIRVVNATGRAVGVIVASLFNLLNLEKVILGGPFSAAGNALLFPLQDEVSRRALPSVMVYGRIELSGLGADAASIGAASLVLRDPVYSHD